ncbi:S-layer homology domain-containing protein [Paenibacillus sp. UNC499MF]|uniref:S-layer homology domain-containing protein n=1 Tax=Paenibacillus sp. UNC499MF TaxID=1502751 RepID=UPI0008A04E3F|nr:S-layer homology domain-containing protein [Paenibacillus sp. UNC499MF]SEG61308.1 S-layer homology domain-containing protein [Paenibacillus sp. UNC499MF]
MVASGSKETASVSTPVTDIAGHPAEKAMPVLLESGAVKPDDGGRFRPDEPVTRREFIHFKAARTLDIEQLSFEKDIEAAAAANVSSKDFKITVRSDTRSIKL